MIPTAAFPCEWSIRESIRNPVADYPSKAQLVTEIRCWAFDTEGNPMLIRFPGAPIQCWLQLPRKVPKAGRPDWTDYDVAAVAAEITRRLQPKIVDEDDEGDIFVPHVLTGCSLQKRNLLHYYDPDNSFEVPMLMLVFNTVPAMRAFRRSIDKMPKFMRIGDGWDYFEPILHEDKQINAIRRMTSLRNIKYTGWFKFPRIDRVPAEKSVLSDRYKDVYKSLTGRSVPTEWFVDWRTIERAPEINIAIKPVIGVYDLETNSHDGTFPKATHILNDIFAISYATWKTSSLEETVRMYGLTTVVLDEKTINAPLPGYPSIIPQRREFNSEADMLKGFQELIRETDPDIIIGYNIDEFDTPYFGNRVRILGEPFVNFGRLEDDKVRVNEHVRETNESKEKKGDTGALMTEELKVPGRVMFDLLPYVRRNYSLRDYKLNTVSDLLFKESKMDVDITKEMFPQLRAHRKLLANRKKGIEINDEEWSTSCENMTRLLDYCMVDSLLVARIFEKLGLWTELCEFSFIMDVPISTLYTRGQQVRVFSLIADAAFSLGFVIDKQAWEVIQVAGAIVQPPMRGIWDQVQCLDFASLYPSIIMAYNICFSTLIPKRLYGQFPKNTCNVFEITQDEAADPDKEAEHIIMDDIVRMPDGHYESVASNDEFEADTAAVQEETAPARNAGDSGPARNAAGLVKVPTVQVGKSKKANVEWRTVYREVRFVDKKTRIGLLPRILERLVGERKATKAEMKKAKEKYGEFSFEYMTLDKRQLALKVTANALYGFIGCQRNGMLPLPEGFICVTTRGRELISTIIEYTIRNYPGTFVVYGDTDSFMYIVPGKSGAEADAIGKAIEKETEKGLNGLFPPPIKMEYEKRMRMYLKDKKMYAYYKYKFGTMDFELDAQGRNPELNTKGLRSARRDNCALQVRLYDTGIRNLLNLHTPIELMKSAVNEIIKVVKGELPLSDLAINKSCGIYSSDSTAPLKTYVQRMKELGVLIAPHERSDFVICKPSPGKPNNISHRMYELGWYLRQPAKKRPEIDMMYYLDRAISSFDEIPAMALNAWAGSNKARCKALDESAIVLVGNKVNVLENLRHPVLLMILAIKYLKTGYGEERSTTTVKMLNRLVRWMSSVMDEEKPSNINASDGQRMTAINEFFH